MEEKKDKFHSSILKTFCKIENGTVVQLLLSMLND